MEDEVFSSIDEQYDPRDEIIKKFEDLQKDFYNEVRLDFERYKEEPTSGLLKCMKDKYPHLKRAKRLTKRTKKNRGKGLCIRSFKLS